jgi:hypothetical protein
MPSFAALNAGLSWFFIGAAIGSLVTVGAIIWTVFKS